MAKAPRKSAPQTSASGYYAVQLARAFPDHGFTYRPSHDLTVDEATLARMQAEPDLVLSATPAEVSDGVA